MNNNKGRQSLAPLPEGQIRSELFVNKTSGITKASRACTECQRMKAKCSGVTPCKRCRKHNIQCVIDMDTDERRKLVLKRKIDLLQQDSDLFSKFLETLRDSKREKISDLLAVVRNGVSLSEIRILVAENLAEKSLTEDCSVVEESHSQAEVKEMTTAKSLHKALDIEWLSDVPVFQVPTHPWTSITNDKDFVSHLVSLWFTWHRPLCSTQIEQHLFLGDMQARDQICIYCSPLLVNAMLAEACFSSNYSQSFAVPGESHSKGGHFFDEANRLLEEEGSRISLPTAQALGILHTTATFMGKDELSWTYLLRATDVVCRLTVADAVSITFDTDKARVLDIITWGLFHSTMVSSLSRHMPPTMNKPLRNLLSCESHVTNTWCPYPLQSPSCQVHTNCIFNQISILNLIGWDVADVLFGDIPPERHFLQIRAKELHGRLVCWHGTIPACIAAQDGSVPGVLYLHIYYHSIVMTLFRFLKAPAGSDETSMANACNARSICIQSAYNVTELISNHRLHWGLRRMRPSCIQCISISLFSLLDDLHNTTSCAAFTTLCAAIRSSSSCYRLARDVLLQVHSSARNAGIELPQESGSLFDDF